MGVSDSGIAGPRQFPDTSWSAILRLRDSSSPEYGRSMARLAELYWRPVYCVIRHSWSRTTDEAKDLTQEFFAAVVLDRELFRTVAPERGSFRALVHTALNNFLCNQARDAGRQKRGGGTHIVPFDAGLPEVDAVAAGATTPEALFDAAWNDAVLSRALAAVQASLAETGRADWFEAFRRYDLEGTPGLTYETLAGELGWTVRKLRRVLTDARAELRTIATRLVREYVDSPEELRAELKALLGG